MARVQEPPPGLDGFAGIAGVLRTPVLRLEQVAVAAAGEVEGVPPWTDQGPALALQGSGAVADGADQGWHRGKRIGFCWSLFAAAAPPGHKCPGYVKSAG